MIETIIQCDGPDYPFDQLEDSPGTKASFLIRTNSYEQMMECKSKSQKIKQASSPHLVNLLQVYQEGRILHLIFECVPCSLQSFLQLYRKLQSTPDSTVKKRQLMKSLALELSSLSEFLISMRLFTEFQFENFGVLKEKQTSQYYRLKYFLSINYRTFREHEDLQEHYMHQKKKILHNIETAIQLERKSEYFPGFILKSNKLLFFDEISETTTKKFKNPQDKNNCSDYFDDESKPKRPKLKKNKKTTNKPHKNSCNFDRGSMYQNVEDKLNRSFDDQSDNISMTQTRSMKIEIQRQKPNSKRRKNSVKFKITTFEEICIDEDVGVEAQKYFSDREHEDYEEAGQDVNPKVKQYRQKVKEAKMKAQSLLSEYFRNKNKSSPGYS